ncbi:hypothetical protein STAS_34369 [Striga asiatica]|uniref:Uncharacterized protein n=1 Tax=Striga asiatica TaxID=4170 RepID=A0A5A7RHF3_STRAF|nr:hypothetical protein STAS_34369 [Striga asiatica]
MTVAKTSLECRKQAYELVHDKAAWVWGSPWSSMEPTTEINRTLTAIRYLMRFQNEYTCGIMNKVRHSAFGREAAKMVHELSSENLRRTEHDMEKFLWSNHNLWVPQPLLSMHVKMGDKPCEMTFSDLKNNAFGEQSPGALPALQECVAFYRNAEILLHEREAINGEHVDGNLRIEPRSETSSNYPLVNFLMATEADFFIGALGSTWCFLIDGM